jgi:hypothetical protein
MTDNELITKAWKLYFRTIPVSLAEFPIQSLCSVEYRDTKKFVVLRNRDRALGVWRVKDDRYLRRLIPCYDGYPVEWFETQRALNRFVKAHIGE